jgi:putative acyl-CoA dehydrogenase
MAHELREPTAPFHTHEVANQAPPLEGRNLFEDNVALVEALEREGAGWALERAQEVGAAWGAEPIAWGFEANENPPRLKAFDRYGNRIDEVEFHRAWHDLMGLAVRHELHCLPWTSAQPAAHAARTALYLTAAQAEGGFACPITMTFAAVPALRAQPELAALWEPRLTATTYDPRLAAPGEKRSALCGMAMTEKQGGSDVRANTTVARPVDGGSGGEYELTGHKWFCSAPMCDLFLVLAQTDAGVTCFALPRILPDGTRNAFHIQRLKDKLGNRSNASSEIELHGAWAQIVGEPGRGVPTIIEMVGHTRLDCIIGTAAGMRWGVANATWHAAHRSAFGRRLADQPLMQNVLADLCIESEAATALAMRLARAYDEAGGGGEAALALKRLGTAIGKYWVCKRGPGHAFEALECLGGNGYVEESGMPRLYREMPLASIWEGSGNVMALDVLRALRREPGALEAYFDEVEEAAGADARLDAFVSSLGEEFTDPEALDVRARRIVERLALALQGALLVRFAPPYVADAFCASRLAGDAGLQYGTLPASVDCEAIVARHTPPA